MNIDLYSLHLVDDFYPDKMILLADVKSIGKKGQIVNVSDGYARNMILPKKLGVEATPKNMNDLKLQKANDEKVARENLEAAKAESKAQWEEAKAMGDPDRRKAMMQAERDEQIAAAKERTEAAQRRIDNAKNSK